MGFSRTNKDNTKSKKERVLKVGKVYEVKTFAGVKVFMKILGTYPESDTYYRGVLLRKDDIEKLISAGVPYSKQEDPQQCEGVVYPFQVIREIRNYENTRSKTERHKGKRRRYVRSGSRNDKPV